MDVYQVGEKEDRDSVVLLYTYTLLKPEFPPDREKKGDGDET